MCEEKKKSNGLILALMALGVVYGDIGTSPLYAVKEMFFGHKGLPMNPENILGAISTVFWALTLVVTIKYVMFVLRADHEKEGGVFALYGILKKLKWRKSGPVLVLLILAAGFLFGDGVITPAISVISAVEGLVVLSPGLENLVTPITIAILTGLFAVQKFGTAKVGSVFGPLMMIWFTVIGLLGLRWIVVAPEILLSLSPIHAIKFLSEMPIMELLTILGFVMLVVTGGEAMYADMGHFGKNPIRISWLAIVYPTLILNYMGQGALMLSGQKIVEKSIFFSMVPEPLLPVMVILATIATVIASQALITGAFSLAAQAVSLGLLPLLPIKHTHEEHHGQIYIAPINTLLYIGCVALVIAFQTSSNLASAYGLAVSFVMMATTIAVFAIAVKEWKWSKLMAILIMGPFALVDISFVVANSIKFFQGGYVPMVVGVTLAIIMWVWQWGVMKIKESLAEKKMTIKELLAIRNKAKSFGQNTTVLLSPNYIEKKTDQLPPISRVYVEKYAIFPAHLVLLTINMLEEPWAETRIEYAPLDIDQKQGTILSVRLNFGFMEEPSVEKYLPRIAKQYPMATSPDISNWVFHVVHKKLVRGGKFSLIKKWAYGLYSQMYKNTQTMDDYLGLGKKTHLTMEVVEAKIK